MYNINHGRNLLGCVNMVFQHVERTADMLYLLYHIIVFTKRQYRPNSSPLLPSVFVRLPSIAYSSVVEEHTLFWYFINCIYVAFKLCRRAIEK